MKYCKYLAFVTLFVITACKKNESYFLKEIVSNEKVLLTLNLKKSPQRDSLSISIPNEYQITINDLNLRYFNINYLINNRYLKEISEYIIYDKKNKIPIFSFEGYLTSKDSFSIVIREKNHLISRDEADKLMKKYKIKESINNLKFQDTIKLVSYKRFRQENFDFINELRKYEDKIRIINNSKNEEFFKQKDYKINW